MTSSEPTVLSGQLEADVDTSLLEVAGLSIGIDTGNGNRLATRRVDLSIHPGRTLGVVGESGSGKSMTAAAILGLLPPNAEIISGSITWHGQEMQQTDKERLRGREITLINQEPMASLDPLRTIGSQLSEVLRAHRSVSKRAARQQAVELMELVGIRDPDQRFGQYPWQFSGGMAQRAVIAMAIAPEPDLIIADEPTTSVDVTIQAQILGELRAIQAEMGLSLMLITHDLGVVSGMADEIVVMYAGRTVESGRTWEVVGDPLHPYSAALLASTPDPRSAPVDRLPSIPGAPPADIRLAQCPFRPRCAHATDTCAAAPDLEAVGATTRKVACWHADR